MQSRRTFIKGAVATTAIGAAGSSFAAESTRSVLVFDAMGEIREVYDRVLLNEMLDSGLNAITKTMCDPKTFEREALNAALEGIRSFDKWIAANPTQVAKAGAGRRQDRRLLPDPELDAVRQRPRHGRHVLRVGPPVGAGDVQLPELGGRGLQGAHQCGSLRVRTADG